MTVEIGYIQTGKLQLNYSKIWCKTCSRLIVSEISLKLHKPSFQLIDIYLNLKTQPKYQDVNVILGD